MGRLRLTVVLLAAAALAAPAAASAYGWPLKPFDRQHAVRGNFDDPRIDNYSTDEVRASFHFGIDISAPDDTPVYAVASGVAIPKGYTLRVRQSARHEFAYWHIYPIVWRAQHIRKHQLIGYVASGYGHVHFAEEVNGVWVNPLRRGALSPYVDHTRPTVAAVKFQSGDATVDPLALSGVVDVVADAWDTPPITPPPPWNDPKLSPALIRWRVLGTDGALASWHVAVDFRWGRLPINAFSYVYAPGTRQNRPNRPGRYSYYLARDWNTTELPNGPYRLEVEALDTRGNVGSYELPFVVAN